MNKLYYSFSNLCLSLTFVMFLQTEFATAVDQNDQYLSNGDNHYQGNWLPLDSPSAIDASFDLLKDVYNTRRIFWRGMEAQLQIETVPRPEHVVYNRLLSQEREMYEDQHLNQYATQAAHARGMEIWGELSLYDWGSSANVGVFGFPASHEHPIRVQNPEWVPVDKYGVRHQGGPLEYAYPEARAASINWIDTQIQDSGFDGVLFHTYAENYSTRYGDEFGFSDPIVDEFKSRYGVDIRYEDFDKTAWYELRGEYTSTYLQELHDTISPNGKKIGMAINPLDADRPMLWLGNNSFPTAGNIDLDWQKWAQDGSVDQMVVWGGTGLGPTTLNELKNGTQGTATEVGAMTSSPYSATWAPFKQQGGVVTVGESFDWQYLVRSNIPVQPKSSLSSPDQYLRMRTLSQIFEGTTTATSLEVIPLLNDPNVLNKRIALQALGKIGDFAAILGMEEALADTDASVRNAAIYGLRDANRTESYNSIMSAVDTYGGFSLMEGAYQVLRTQPDWRAQLVNTLETDTNPNTRMVAMRTLSNGSFANSLSAAEVAAVAAAATDPEPEVRAFAITTLGLVTSLNSPLAVQTLVDALASDDTIVSSRAASALSYSIQFHAPAAEARKTELIGHLADAFAAQGDGTTRGDKDWAYRVIGNALSDFGGQGVLQPFMDQREDRRLSELAWEVLYIPLRSHQAVEPTAAEDSFAFFKRPRWDKVLASSDSFDSHTLGGSINNQTPEAGFQWVVPSVNAAEQVIQDEYSKSGYALKAVRRQGDLHLIKLEGYEREVEAAELTTVTAKADWMHQNVIDSTRFAIGLGGLYGPSVYADPTGHYRYWQSDGSTQGGHYVDSGYLAGTDAWETIEIVLTLNLAIGNILTGSYDVYLERDAGGSLNALTRTLIADDVSIFPFYERTLMDLIITNQSNGIGDVVTYWDNVSLTVDGVFPFAAGDFNEDGYVDETDLGAWQNGYGTNTNATHGIGDADKDGDVDGADFLIWQRGWSPAQNSSSANAAVPEPSTLVILGCLFQLIALGRCRPRVC